MSISCGHRLGAELGGRMTPSFRRHGVCISGNRQRQL